MSLPETLGPAKTTKVKLISIPAGRKTIQKTICFRAGYSSAGIASIKSPCTPNQITAHPRSPPTPSQSPFGLATSGAVLTCRLAMSIVFYPCTRCKCFLCSIVLPFPVILQQHCKQHLNVFTPYSVFTTNIECSPLGRFAHLFPTSTTTEADHMAITDVSANTGRGPI